MTQRTYSNDMDRLELHLPLHINQLIIRSELHIFLLARMVLVHSFPARHQLHLVVPVREDLGGVVVAFGDVGEEFFPQRIDLYIYVRYPSVTVSNVDGR